MKCPVCGLDYDDFHTGMTFAEVQAEMFVDSDDPADWVYKRRGSVLRRWRKIKEVMWDYHQRSCAGEVNFQFDPDEFEQAIDY